MFYKEHYHEDPDAFHKAHHKYMNWSHDYTHFQHQQGVIVEADRERSIFKFDLEVMETLEYFLTNHKQLGRKKSLEYAFDVVRSFRDKLIRDIAEYNAVIIPELERRIEDNEYFKEHDYFRDVDPIGFKNISWKEYLDKRCNIGTNNGPVKFRVF